MSSVRDEWAAFKKAHPAFDKANTQKLDLGPQLDAWYTVWTAILKQIEAIEPKKKFLEQQEKAFEDAVKSYHIAISKSSDPKAKMMVKDLDDVIKDFKKRIASADTTSRLKGLADRYDV